jgi:hypothetical protein
MSVTTSQSAVRTAQRLEIVLAAALSILLGVIVSLIPLGGRAALAVVLAVMVLFLLLIGTLVRPAAAVIAIFGFLTVVGLLRRIAPAITESFQVDPLLLIAPATALALVVRTHPQTNLAGRDAISVLGLGFVAFGVAEVLNPLDGGVVPGAVGLLYSVFPIVWFWIGSVLATSSVIIRVGWLSVILATCVGVYGLYQVQVGFPPWDAEWLAAHLSDYRALVAGGAVRAFGTFASSAEFAAFLGIGVTFVIVSLNRRRIYLVVPGGLLLVALFLDASRGIFVLTVLASALAMAFRSRSRRGAIVIGATAATATVAIGLLSASITTAAIQTANPFVIHQIAGLLNPFDPSQSTLLTHMNLVAQGFGSAIQAPFGYGPAATNLAGTRLATLNLSTEFDISNEFVNLGFVGGLIYLAIAAIAMTRAIILASRDPRPEHIWIMAVMVVGLGQWMNGGYYLLAPLTWFLIGGMNRAWRDRESEKHRTGHAPSLVAHRAEVAHESISVSIS